MIHLFMLLSPSARRAYSGGWRAGMAPSRFLRHGGERDVLCLSRSLNPYANIFAPRWRPLLALAWDCGQYEGTMNRFNQKGLII